MQFIQAPRSERHQPKSIRCFGVKSVVREEVYHILKPRRNSYYVDFLLCRFAPWFSEPVVAGLDSNNDPYLSGMDLIGAPVLSNTFTVAGTCTSNLHGMCEALYKPNMVI